MDREIFTAIFMSLCYMEQMFEITSCTSNVIQIWGRGVYTIDGINMCIAYMPSIYYVKSKLQ